MQVCTRNRNAKARKRPLEQDLDFKFRFFSAFPPSVSFFLCACNARSAQPLFPPRALFPSPRSHRRSHHPFSTDSSFSHAFPLRFSSGIFSIPSAQSRREHALLPRARSGVALPTNQRSFSRLFPPLPFVARTWCARMRCGSRRFSESRPFRADLFPPESARTRGTRCALKERARAAAAARERKGSGSRNRRIHTNRRLEEKKGAKKKLFQTEKHGRASNMAAKRTLFQSGSWGWPGGWVRPGRARPVGPVLEPVLGLVLLDARRVLYRWGRT